jgi:hypothetical protein
MECPVIRLLEPVYDLLRVGPAALKTGSKAACG